jgi:phospholipid transport system substrate-binding protein
MPLSRRHLLGLPLAILAAGRAAAAEAPPAVVIQRFYEVLLAVMKEAKQLSFDARYQRLAPAITQTLNLPLMARIAVGPQWAAMSADQQRRVSAAFARYTISVYANRFDGYGGERFEVTPQPAANTNGVVVDSRIVKSNGKPVTLDYLMRRDAAGAWRVIDVYLSGTISELATRRAEFTDVLRRTGADGLVEMLDKRAAALRAG